MILSQFLNERSVESSGTSDNGSGRSATAVAAGGGVCKPPLAPSHKRKRDSRGGGGGGSSSSSSAAAAAVSDELLMAAAAPSSSQHPSTSSSSSSSSMLGTPASSWSREEQQLLLKQLLYQELESQGILSSPFASFINHNCSGLLQPQSQDSTSLSADISSLLGLSHFQGQQGLVQGGGVSTPIPAPTPALLAAAAAEPTPSASAGTSVGAGVGTKLGAPYAGASPNSISIATAIALLAASHAARGTSAGASAVGHSPYQNQNHQLLQQQHQAYTPAAAAAAVANEVLPFGTIDRIVNNNTVACTPQPLHSSMHHLHHIRHQQQMQDGGTLSQQEQDCTDGETTTGSLGTSSTTSTSGGVRTVRSDSFSDTRPSSLTADHTSCSSFPSKVLFGKDTDCEPSEHAFDSFGVGAPTSTNAAAADVNKGWTGAVGGCQSHQGLGQRLGMSEAGQREKENAGPNSSSSCSLVTMLLR